MINEICIAQNIKEFRTSRNLSQKEFGRLVGVSAQAVSKWEREIAYPDLFTLPVIAKILGVSVDELLTVNQEEKEA